MSESSPRFRPILDRFAPYRPGGSPAGPDGKSFKLSSNESPFGPLPSVVEAIAAAARQVNRYPDNAAAALTDAIASRFGVPAGAHRGRLRLGRGDRAAAGGGRRAGRGDHLRLALVRGLSAARRPGRGRLGAGAARRPCPRPGRDGGRDHRPDQDDLRLQPEQPDRHGRAPGGAGAVPGPGAGQLPGDTRRGLPRVRAGQRTCRTVSACTATGPTWPCSARSPRRTGSAGLRVGFMVAPSRWPPRPARPCCRSP